MQPSLQKDEQVIAICCADIHLSHKPPIWRSSEPDWYEAMESILYQVSDLWSKCGGDILYAGDIFEHWNASAELINFALRHLPKGRSIPGQHDLPNHNQTEINKSAYWTLISSGHLLGLDSEGEDPYIIDLDEKGKKQMRIYGYPFGSKIKPVEVRKGIINICLAHEYYWIKGHNYQTASAAGFISDSTCTDKNGKWKGYDIVILGDNHSGFITKVGTTTVFNCGSLMRRRSDQKDYQPMVGLITDKGNVIPHYLDISQDKYVVDSKLLKQKEKTELDMTDFMKELETLGDAGLDFLMAIKRFCQKHKIDKSITKVLNEVLRK